MQLVTSKPANHYRAGRPRCPACVTGVARPLQMSCLVLRYQEKKTLESVKACVVVVAKLYEMTTVSILCCPVINIWNKPCIVVYETTTDESRRCPIEMSTLPDLRYSVSKTWDVVNHCFSVYEMVNLAKHYFPIYDSEVAGGLCVTVYESMNAIRLCHQVVNMISMLCFCYHVKTSCVLTIKLVLGYF